MREFAYLYIFLRDHLLSGQLAGSLENWRNDLLTRTIDWTDRATARVV